MSDMQQKKGSDEIFCPSCGEIIKKASDICPKCGLEQNNSIVKTNNTFAIASLVLGIIGSLFMGILIIPGILGFIFSFKGLKSKKRGMAIAGLVLNSLQLPMIIIIVIYFIEQFQRREMLLKFFGLS
jgi:hypothetical protein